MYIKSVLSLVASAHTTCAVSHEASNNWGFSCMCCFSLLRIVLLHPLLPHWDLPQEVISPQEISYSQHGIILRCRITNTKCALFVECGTVHTAETFIGILRFIKPLALVMTLMVSPPQRLCKKGMSKCNRVQYYSKYCSTSIGWVWWIETVILAVPDKYHDNLNLNAVKGMFSHMAKWCLWYNQEKCLHLVALRLMHWEIS
jgi:hypothetical protein